MQYVTLVNESDVECGICEKMEAHKEKKLHRAFSVFIFNQNGELLIQKRAKCKYHSAGLWSNSCCSHPEHGKDIIEDIKDRVGFELGIECTNVRKMFDIIYDVKLGQLFEFEYDYVYFADYKSGIDLNYDEVEEVKWIKIADLYKDINENPDNYTFWFKKILAEGISHFLTINELFSIHKKEVIDLIDDTLKKYEYLPADMREELNYCIKNVGKMKRSYIISTIYYMISSQKTDSLNYLMAAVELMQNASLIHDDIIDNAEIRRGKEAAAKKYGVNSAIIMGDFSIFLANLFISKLALNDTKATEVSSALNEAFLNMCLGEQMEESVHNSEFSLDLYNQTIYLKTASFFSAVCKAAGILADASDEEQEALEEFGKNVGIAYQMKDDLLSYLNIELDKDVNNDIERKAITYPIINAYNNGSDKERLFIRSWIESSEKDTVSVEKIKELIEKKNNQCLEKIRSYMNDAKARLNIFKDCFAKQILINTIEGL